MTIKYRIAVVLSLCLTVSGIALAQSNSTGGGPPAQAAEPAQQAADSMDPPMVGDHWIYEIRDEITGELKSTRTDTITDLTPTEIAVRAQFEPNVAGPVGFIYDRSWNMKNNAGWRYSPNDGSGIKMPLAVGNTWKFQYDQIRSGAGTAFKMAGTSKVVGMESVTTGAGTFQALKIETATTGHNANDATKRWQITLTTWYVPSIDRWVKRTGKTAFNGHVTENNSQELIEFGRR
jgi:hypothetical protein